MRISPLQEQSQVREEKSQRHWAWSEASKEGFSEEVTPGTEGRRSGAGKARGGTRGPGDVC